MSNPEDLETLPDKLGRLNEELRMAMEAKQLDKAQELRARIADLLDDGREDHRVGLDWNDEFVRKWYSNPWG